MAAAALIALPVMPAPAVAAGGTHFDVSVSGFAQHDFVGDHSGYIGLGHEGVIILAQAPMNDPFEGLSKNMDGGSAIITTALKPEGGDGRRKIAEMDFIDHSSIANGIGAGNFPAAAPRTIKRLMMAPELKS